jgi:putative transposase
VTTNASDQPFLDLGKAFPACFEGRARRPRFKSKTRSQPSCYLANEQWERGDHRLGMPQLGWVKMAEHVRFQGKVTGARVTTTADGWFVSLGVELPDARPEHKQAAVGIDVGLSRLGPLSTGQEVEHHAFLTTALKQVRQANQRLHRRKRGSQNREQARRQVARLHSRLSCMREDVLHKLTTRLANCFGISGVANLNLGGWRKNRRLARSFSDASLGTLRRLLEAKVAERGRQVISVDRVFPSHKPCHCCGWKWQAMTLTDWVCVCQNPACPYEQFPHDRAHNAAQKVLREALRLIGLLEQAVSGPGSDQDVNWAVDAG